jgi:hypothetical protein
MRHHSWSCLGDSGKYRRHQRPKHGDVIARSMNHDYRDRDAGEILLMLDASIDCDENIKLRCGELE